MSWPEIVYDLAILPHSSMLSQAQKISTVSKLDQANGIGTTNRHRSCIQFATAAIMVSIFFPWLNYVNAYNAAKRKKRIARAKNTNHSFVMSIFLFSLCFFLSIFVDLSPRWARVARRWIKIVLYNVHTNIKTQPNNCYVNKWKIHREFVWLFSLCSAMDREDDKYQRTQEWK